MLIELGVKVRNNLSQYNDNIVWSSGGQHGWKDNYSSIILLYIFTVTFNTTVFKPSNCNMLSVMNRPRSETQSINPVKTISFFVFNSVLSKVKRISKNHVKNYLCPNPKFVFRTCPHFYLLNCTCIQLSDYWHTMYVFQQ